MEIGELETLLRQQGIDTASLEPVLSRGDERIYQLRVRPDDALARWYALRDLVPVTGYWPVLGWGRRWLDDVPEYRAQVEIGLTAEILEESEKVDLARWKQAQMDEFLEFVKEDAKEYELEPITDFFEDVQGEWPEDAAPYTEFSIPQSKETREPISPILIALIPTTQSWQVPAFLRFDTFDASPAVHTAMARRWNERYGAEIIGVLPDLIEIWVTRPPTTREDALALAKEQ
jgi:hypothetical protein